MYSVLGQRDRGHMSNDVCESGGRGRGMVNDIFAFPDLSFLGLTSNVIRGRKGESV